MTATALLLLASLSAPPAEAPPDATIATWVADLSSSDGSKQRAATEALLKAGPKAKSAVPALLKMIDPKTGQGFQAVEILGAIGPDAKAAVPVLMGLLPKEPGTLGYGAEHVAVALAKIDGPKIEATRALLFGTTKGGGIFLASSSTLREYPADVVRHLVALCADKDAKAREKAAAVIAVLKHKEVTKVPVASVFEKAGDATKGIPAALEKLLADPSVEVRLAAARAVTQVAPELTDKALAVVIALAVAVPDTKKGELYAHEVFHPVPEKAARVLVPLFDHERDRVRMWAITHVAQLSVREPVEDALKNGTTARIRQAAALALGARYSTAVASVPALTAALADGEFVVRFAAAEALVQVGGRGGAAGAAAVPVLVEGLQQKDERVRLEASQNLLRVGPPAKAAVPALKKLLDDPEAAVRLEAALTLVGLDKAEAAGAVPALIGGLKLAEPTAARAAKALAGLGPVAKEAVPELLTRFDAKNVHLRLYSAEAAARIDPAHAPKAVDVLVALLAEKKHKSSMIRAYGLTALRHIGPNAKPALPMLAELLGDDGPFHTDAALTMIAIDPDSEPAFAWVRKVLAGKSNDDYEDVYDLMERLPQLGAGAAPLVPDLTALLKSKVLFHRKRAIETLGAVGPAAKGVLPDLKKIAESDPRQDVRELAAAAVKKIEAK